MMLARSVVNPGASRRLPPHDLHTPRPGPRRFDPGGPGTQRALTTWCASATADRGSGLRAGTGPHGHAWVFTPARVPARAALSHRVVTGLSRRHLADLIVEPADPWTAAHQRALRQRRGPPRRRAPAAGPHHRLVFADRVLVALVIPRFRPPQQAPGGAVGRGPRHRHPRGRRGPAAAGRAAARLGGGGPARVRLRTLGRRSGAGHAGGAHVVLRPVVRSPFGPEPGAEGVALRGAQHGTEGVVVTGQWEHVVMSVLGSFLPGCSETT